MKCSLYALIMLAGLIEIPDMESVAVCPNQKNLNEIHSIINADSDAYAKFNACVLSGYVSTKHLDRDKKYGILNNNPLNIKALDNGEKWQGQIGVDSFGHAIFDSVKNGVRAARMVLKNYKKRHGIDTVSGIVKRFAEHNHTDYIIYLCVKLDVDPDQHLDFSKVLNDLLVAMARFETGKNLPKELFF